MAKIALGALWILPAIGFVATALALVAGWDWWQPVLLGPRIAGSLS